VGIGQGGDASIKNSGNSSSTVKDSGNSTIKDSGNSSVEDSGNSSSKSVATGGSAKQGQTQGQQQSSTSASSASDNGNGSNNASYSSEYVGARIPVTTAYAPAVAPTASCFKGWGGGVQFPQIGASLGGGKIDVNCAILEVARNYDVAGERYAACKVKISNKYSKAAGVTMEDCMKENTPIIPPARAEEPGVPVALFVPGQGVPTSIVPEPQVKAIPVPVVQPAPTVVPANPIKPSLVGVCTFAPGLQCKLPGPSPDPLRVTSICDQMLASVIRLLDEFPDSKLHLIGNATKPELESNTMFSLARAKSVQRKLVSAGVSPNRITVEVGTNNTRTVELWLQ
jgi:hypothetical protein